MIPQLLILLPLLVIFANAHVLLARDNQTEEELKLMFLRLYLSNDIEQYVDATVDEAKNHVSRMDLTKPTVIYIHGYTGSVQSKDVITIVSSYLERADHNVIAADWSPIAGKNYPSVVRSAEPVGRALATAIDDMIDNGMTRDSLHVLGHSMGAQVAGYAGRFSRFPLTRITGLDPAGPFFNLLEAHLGPSDAKFVDTIHTDAGFYGISRPSGLASFYPNNGKRIQPGCPTSYELSSPEDYCSHHRSWIYYAESLKNENAFIGATCSTYKRFLDGSCDESAKVPMGYATPIDTKGIFYLRTRNESPFGMQMDGALSPISKRDSNNEM